MTTILEKYDKMILEEAQKEVENDPRFMIIWVCDGKLPITVLKNPFPFEYEELPNG